MNEINTHNLYKTISHDHLDDLVSWTTGEYPESGLSLVECENGLWFIEQEYGHDYDQFSGISKLRAKFYTELTFFSSREEALAKAIELIKQVHKNVDDGKLLEYLMQE